MSIICLTKGLSLIDIGAIWLLSLVYSLMRIIASFLRDAGYLNFMKYPISQVVLRIFSLCSTTELSISLTSCLTAIKKTCNKIL